MIRREVNRGTVFTRRALIVAGAQTLLLGGLAARLRQVQVDEGSRYATMAEDNRVTGRMIAPQRGRILDRFGAPLAGNLINWRALLVTEQAANVRQSLDNFSEIVPLTDAERARIDRDLRHGKSFIPILIKEFLSRDAMTKIEVNAPDLPGIMVDAGTSRTYNYPYELAHILGYVAPPNESDVDGDPLMALPGLKVGRAGIEKFHDLALRGRPGVIHLEVNAVGRVIRELDRTDGVNGDDVGLTFDVGLQLAIQKMLGDDAASAVVLDCRNGEIMAMVSNPSFDPTLFATGVSQAQWKEWTKDRRTPLINKATSGLYAPGSTFKMAVALAGLDAKTLSVHDRLNCPGHLDLGSSRFHCWNKAGHGPLDLHQALKYSCDVYFYQVALRTGIDRISAMAHGSGWERNSTSTFRVNASDWCRPENGGNQQRPSLGTGRHGRERHWAGVYCRFAVAIGDLRRADRHRPGRSTPLYAPDRRRHATRTRNLTTGRTSPFRTPCCKPCDPACSPW